MHTNETPAGPPEDEPHDHDYAGCVECECNAAPWSMDACICEEQARANSAAEGAADRRDADLLLNGGFFPGRKFLCGYANPERQPLAEQFKEHEFRAATTPLPQLNLGALAVADVAYLEPADSTADRVSAAIRAYLWSLDVAERTGWHPSLAMLRSALSSAVSVR